MGFYSRHVLPTIISCGCGVEPIMELRRKWAPRAEGVVLELGMGSGHNLAFYDPRKVTQVYGLEPEPGMLARAERRTAGAPVPVTVLPERAEDVSLPGASVDTVFVTFTMCTIPDVVTALRGARRVLKPGGKLLFCEHGQSPEFEVARRQARLEPLWKKVFGGCHLTRDIPALLRKAGFTIETLEAGYMPKGPKFASYLYQGAASAA
jgi:ubiquinone/menaquinone biosynthesis C-methylase UbiE